MEFHSQDMFVWKQQQIMYNDEAWARAPPNSNERDFCLDMKPKVLHASWIMGADCLYTP
jgi:hypothetical protein